MIENLFNRIRPPRQVGIKVGEGRFLINESVSYDDGEILTQPYLDSLFPDSSNFLAYNGGITRTLVGTFFGEASRRRLDEIYEAQDLERAFLEGNRMILEQLRRLI